MAFYVEESFIYHLNCPNLDFNPVELSKISECTHNEEFQEYLTHLELGAANFGLLGHTYQGLSKTVLKDVRIIPTQINYIDLLPAEINFCPNPDYQFSVLFSTVETLVNKHKTDKIIFHVNDIDIDNTDYTVARLKDYTRQKGYNNMIVEPVPGNYTQINTYKYLGKYYKYLYDSVHLKNPDESFFHDVLGSRSEYTSYGVKRGIQNLLIFTTYGCNITLFDTMRGLIPKPVYTVLLELGILKLSNEYDPVEYVFPEGDIIWPANRSLVFDIKAPNSNYLKDKICNIRDTEIANFYKEKSTTTY